MMISKDRLLLLCFGAVIWIVVCITSIYYTSMDRTEPVQKLDDERIVTSTNKDTMPPGSQTARSVVGQNATEVHLTQAEEKTYSANNSDFLPTQVNVSFVLDHPPVPGKFDISKALLFAGESSRVTPPVTDAIVIGDYARSEKNFRAVDRLLSFAKVPFFTHATHGSWGETGLLLIVVPSDRFQDAVSILSDAEKAGSLTRDKAPM
jgi:hypothetical protein